MVAQLALTAMLVISSIGSNHQVSVVFLAEAESFHWRTLPLSLDADGALYDMEGHQVEDKNFAGMMRPDDHPTDPRPACRILIGLRDPKGTSVATVKTVLQKLKNAGDPKRETTIYVRGLH